jgi:hypothetical protein
MIKGVTHDNDGRAIQRLSVSTKVAIGLPPSEKQNHPVKLDHFVFLRKKHVAKGVEWELDPDLMKHYGDDCKEFRIVLLDDDLENIFPTSFAWWTITERKCWGDGQDATRRTEAQPEGEPWHPCGGECEDLKEGRCKPSGDLRFVLADFPKLGSVCRIHTGSYRSVKQLYSSLQEIQSFTGGRMAGLTAKLVVRPEKGTYYDERDKKKKSTTIWALSLEVDGTDMRKVMANLTENAEVFINARKLLGGHVLEVVEDESEIGDELPKEFYPPKEKEAPRDVQMPTRASDKFAEPAAEKSAAAAAEPKKDAAPEIAAEKKKEPAECKARPKTEKAKADAPVPEKRKTEPPKAAEKKFSEITRPLKEAKLVEREGKSPFLVVELDGVPGDFRTFDRDHFETLRHVAKGRNIVIEYAVVTKNERTFNDLHDWWLAAS